MEGKVGYRQGKEAREMERADRPPPPQIAYQEILMSAETGGEYFS
jgi:hypothetical protein